MTEQEKQAVEKQANEKPLTRQQRRSQERLKEEVQSTFKTMCDKFLDFFVSHDEPEGQEVIDKIKQMSTQWRLYCDRKKLIPTLYPVLDNYMDGLLQEYIQSKEKQPENV
jgi:hypothetical protein